MTLPFDIPAWLPWWVPLVLLVPFSVIGLKSRLDGLEARLDEVQTEIRVLSLRLRESGQSIDFDEVYAAPEPVESARRTPVITRPPIPPAAHELYSDESREAPASGSPPRNARRSDPPRRADRIEPRMEPRLDRQR